MIHLSINRIFRDVFLNKKNFSSGLLLLQCFFLSGGLDPAWSAGKKPSDPASDPSGGHCPGGGGAGGAPAFSTPAPVRPVRILPIGTKAFPLPNGVGADLGLDLQSILTTVVTATEFLAPADFSSEGDPCRLSIELRSAVTTFQLDVVDFNFSVGYSPAGPLNGLLSLQTQAKMQVGMISMDFSLWQCDDGNCTAVAASSANQATVGGALQFEVDFSTLKTPAGLVFHPVLGPVLRKIMENGVAQLIQSTRLSELSWSTRVRDYNPASGTLVLSAGEQSRLGPNQTFEVYAPTDQTADGVCNVFQTVAYVHTSVVNNVSSQAVVDQVLDPRGVQKGDVVMVRSAPRLSPLGLAEP